MGAVIAITGVCSVIAAAGSNVWKTRSQSRLCNKQVFSVIPENIVALVSHTLSNSVLQRERPYRGSKNQGFRGDAAKALYASS